MSTDMHLLWVQQLAVLPVIIEDRNIMEQNVQGGGLPLESQTVETSARNRLGESERPAQACTLLQPFFLFFLFFFPSSFPPTMFSFLLSLNP